MVCAWVRTHGGLLVGTEESTELQRHQFHKSMFLVTNELFLHFVYSQKYKVHLGGLLVGAEESTELQRHQYHKSMFLVTNELFLHFVYSQKYKVHLGGLLVGAEESTELQRHQYHKSMFLVTLSNLYLPKYDKSCLAYWLTESYFLVVEFARLSRLARRVIVVCLG